MPPGYAVRIRRNAENIGTFSRREGQDPPLQLFSQRFWNRPPNSKLLYYLTQQQLT